MKNKFAWVAIPLVAVLCAVAYVFFADDPQDPAMSAESELAVPATSETLADGQPAAVEPESETGSALAPDERPLKRESETKGDRTRFSMNHGDIGYVDVNSIMQGRNPYSIVDLLQAHQELTSADDSLEITIERISDNAIWGQEVFYRQTIDGRPLRQTGTVFFQPDGTVTRMAGNLVSSRSLNAGDVLILSPEAETIALNVAARYAENIELAHPERSDVPATLTALSAEMGYDLDSDYNLVRLWNVHVGITGPAGVGDILRVSISPETGEVVRVDSERVPQTGRILVICDAGKAIGEDGQPSTEGIEEEANTCDVNNSVGSPTTVSIAGKCKLEPATLCQDSMYTTPLETVAAVLAEVGTTSPRDVANVIHNIVNHPFDDDDKGGDWSEYYRTIRISDTSSDIYGVAAHEAHHAVSRSPTYGVAEHPLVYGMTAIWTGRDHDWRYEQTSVAHTDRAYTGDEKTTNILYRVAQKVNNRNTAYEFVLDVDLRTPASVDDLEEAMREVADNLGISDEVNEVFVEVDELEELLKLQKQAEREGLSHTAMARQTNSMTNQQIIQWLRDWLRDREDDDKEQ